MLETMRTRSIAALRREAKGCQRCPLWEGATQTVFGSGPEDAAVVLVGEQPGDVEDRAGEPFVGPAGQLLRKAIDEAGLDFERVYLTNVVKHFKWTPRGKRRIHQKPNRVEIAACRLWLELELARLKPRVLVALGATAANALFGAKVKVTRDRGTAIESPLAAKVTATLHPSAILRAPDEQARAQGLANLIEDLRLVAKWAKEGRGA